MRVQSTCLVIVTERYIVAPTPLAVLERNVESATQSVASHADPSMRSRGVGSFVPKFTPATVMLTLPVPGVL